MQFIVLIEFLIPGVATVLLCMALWPGTFQHLFAGVVPPGVLTGETATALLLLVISYPVGHMVNYPIFKTLQQHVFTPWVRRKTVISFLKEGVDIEMQVNQHLNLPGGDGAGLENLSEKQRIARVKTLTGGKLWHLFCNVRAIVLSRNIEYLDSYVFFYKSLQRLARGMLIPIVLSIAFVCSRGGRTPVMIMLVLALAAVFVACLDLLRYSLQAEEDEIVRFFVASTGGEAPRKVQPTQAVKRTDSSLSRGPAAHRK